MVIEADRHLRGIRQRRWAIGHELTLLVFTALLPFAVLGLYWTGGDYRAEQFAARVARCASPARSARASTGWSRTPRRWWKP